MSAGDRDTLVLPGVDLAVWEVVDTHAEWVKVPTVEAGCVMGKYLRLRKEGHPDDH